MRFLLEISSLVHSLHIHQRRTETPYGARYLFGAFDMNWVQIILEMFSNKMDKLFIYNSSYDNYLSEQDADSLREVSALDSMFQFLDTCTA